MGRHREISNIEKKKKKNDIVGEEGGMHLLPPVYDRNIRLKALHTQDSDFSGDTQIPQTFRQLFLRFPKVNLVT